MTPADLAELMDIMRAKGCLQLRTGDVAIVLGPEPASAPARPTIPWAEPEPSPDEEAIKAYQDYLYAGTPQ
jgi:hypothetical protein